MRAHAPVCGTTDNTQALLTTGASDKKGALIIGCDYTDDPKQPGLLGTVNDAFTLAKFLRSRCGFQSPSSIVLMTDGEKKFPVPKAFKGSYHVSVTRHDQSDHPSLRAPVHASLTLTIPPSVHLCMPLSL